MSGESLKRGAVIYVAGLFPLISETFVRREVAALRQRGWEVITISLRRPESGVADEPPADHLVYGEAGSARLSNFMAEALRHPRRTMGTALGALCDALWPGERTSLAGRARLIVGALASIAVARQLRPRNIKHVHCHFAHAPTTIGMYLARQLGIAFSFTGHANDIFQRRALLRRKCVRAAFVACISQWHREFYRREAPGEDTKYPVVRCGVATETWRREGRAASGGPLVVLTVARLVRKKGIDTLVRAIAEVDRPAHRLRLEVMGEGPEAASLKRLADQLDVASRITWHGSVDSEAVRQAMMRADVFMLPCREDERGDRDGIPVVLMEAMACGVPTVSGDLPAIRELIDHERTGLLIDGNDPASAATALKRLIEDEPGRRRLGESGRQRVVEEFDLTVNVQRLESAFREAMQNHE